MSGRAGMLAWGSHMQSSLEKRPPPLHSQSFSTLHFAVHPSPASLFPSSHSSGSSRFPSPQSCASQNVRRAAAGALEKTYCPPNLSSRGALRESWVRRRTFSRATNVKLMQPFRATVHALVTFTPARPYTIVP
jgi:hypothetical protein